MSRIAKKPIVIPSNVHVKLIGKKIIITGKNGVLTYCIHNDVLIKYENSCLMLKSCLDNYSQGWAHAGTTRSLINSMIIGVTIGFFKKLQLFGVGYRISVVDSKNISLSLGYSHLIKYNLPKGITIENPSPVEIVIKGADKQLVGQVAAQLRSYRKPELYKGKGIRYSDEIIRVKEAKKK